MEKNASIYYIKDLKSSSQKTKMKSITKMDTMIICEFINESVLARLLNKISIYITCRKSKMKLK
jgi:hypothetical protein